MEQTATTNTPATEPTSTVSSGDRLSFTIFLAAALHGLLIFGIAFKLSAPNESAPSVTVTLATHASSEEPDNADFIAQANQIGSGSLEEAKQITTGQLSPFSNDTITETQLLDESRKAVQDTPQRDLLSSTKSSTKINSKPTDADTVENKEGKDSRDVQALSKEIASLNAKLDRQRQEYAKRPRERVLTSVSTKASRDAAYLNNWTQKVESIGNQNFPREAISQRITGDLRLQTIIKWDGSLIKAEVIKSSGHRILDDAALQIIHRAVPFLPFPPEIRKDTDQLVIIRTWHFEINGLSTSQ